jgi:hypothetical protein
LLLSKRVYLLSARNVQGTRIAPRPPRTDPACAANAPGSSLGSNVAARGVKIACGPAHSRQSDRRDNSAQCPTTAVCRLFPLGETLPSTTSAGSCLPLFGRFLGTVASSDFSSACMLGVRLVAFPSRPEIAPGHGRDLPGSAQRTSPRAQGLRLREAPLMQAICHETMLPSRQRTRSAPRN